MEGIVDTCTTGGLLVLSAPFIDIPHMAVQILAVLLEAQRIDFAVLRDAAGTEAVEGLAPTLCLGSSCTAFPGHKSKGSHCTGQDRRPLDGCGYGSQELKE